MKSLCDEICLSAGDDGGFYFIWSRRLKISSELVGFHRGFATISLISPADADELSPSVLRRLASIVVSRAVLPLLILLIFIGRIGKNSYQLFVPSLTFRPCQKTRNVHSGIPFFLCVGGRTRRGAVVNDSPVDCQSHEWYKATPWFIRQSVI